MMSATSIGAREATTCSRMAKQRAVAPRIGKARRLSARESSACGGESAAGCPRLFDVIIWPWRMLHTSHSSAVCSGRKCVPAFSSRSKLANDRKRERYDGGSHERAADRTAEENRPVVVGADHAAHKGRLAGGPQNCAQHHRRDREAKFFKKVAEHAEDHDHPDVGHAVTICVSADK